MNTGRVRWFNESKGFGFIDDWDGNEIYFHYTSIVDARLKRAVTSGSQVFFDVFETSIGLEASNVQLSGAG